MDLSFSQNYSPSPPPTNIGQSSPITSNNKFTRNKVIVLGNLDPNASRDEIQKSFSDRGIWNLFVDHSKDSTVGHVRLKRPCAKEFAEALMSEGGIRIGTELVTLRALEGDEEAAYWAVYTEVSHNDSRRVAFNKQKAKVRKPFAAHDTSAKSCKPTPGTSGSRYSPYVKMDVDKEESKSDKLTGEQSNKKKRKKKKKSAYRKAQRENRKLRKQEEEQLRLNSTLEATTLDSSSNIEPVVDSSVLVNSVHMSTQIANTASNDSTEDILNRFEKLYLEGQSLTRY